MDNEQYAQICIEIRRELLSYLQRLTGRPAISEELLQETFLRGHVHRAELPTSHGEIRAWLFAVGSHLAIDSMRKHGNWRETAMDDFREAAESNSHFIQLSKEMIGTPETENIAKEHLAACFTCVLRSFPELKAAALLLKEVYGFSLDEVAGQLDATNGQVKNWLQEARNSMNERYGSSCALVTKHGVCHQCEELTIFFNQPSGDPLKGTARDFNSRIGILKEYRDEGLGRWHVMMFELLDHPVS